MKHPLYFLFLLPLFLTSCDEKTEDHSALDEMVLLEEEKEDTPLVQDFGDQSVAEENTPAPQEMIIQEGSDLR